MAGRRSRKKKSNLASYSQKVSSRKKESRKNAALVGNPGIAAELTDAASLVLPGAAAYAATRLGGRITYNLVAKKKPTLARHLGPVGSLGVWAALWFASTRSEKLSEYTLSIVTGGGIAALQTLLQTYLPVYGWILSDYEFKAMQAKGKPAPEEEDEELLEEDETLSPEPSSGYTGSHRMNGRNAPALSERGSNDADISDIVSDDYAGSLQSGWGVN